MAFFNRINAQIAIPICLSLFVLGHIDAFADCTDGMKEHAKNLQFLQDQSYRSKTGGDVGIIPGNEPTLTIGSKSRAVLVAHGFLASPYEMRAVVDKLTQSGYTVYAPLIYGFGGTPQMANLATMQDFRKSIVDGVNLLRECYTDVSLVGLSWGATLVADYVLNDPDGSRISSLTLFSPYFKARVPFARQINDYTSRYTSTLPKIFADITGASDQRASELSPEHYLSALPLMAVNIALGYPELAKTRDEALAAEEKPITSTVPTQIAVTRYDKTVDPKFALEYVRAHFTQHREFVYPATDAIPHQICVPSVNPLYPRLEQWWTSAYP